MKVRKNYNPYNGEGEEFLTNPLPFSFCPSFNGDTSEGFLLTLS